MRRATWTTAPEEMPAKMPSCWVSSRVARRASTEDDQELAVEDRGVEDRRDEPRVERAQPVDQLAQFGLRGDDLESRRDAPSSGARPR